MAGGLALPERKRVGLRLAWLSLLGFLLVLVIGSVVVVAPRVKFGRTIQWSGIAVDFPRPLICCEYLHDAALFCMPVGKTLWNSIPNLQFFIINVYPRTPDAGDCFPSEYLLELSDLKEGVKVLDMKTFEEGPGPDADQDPCRAWAHQVLQRSEDNPVMAFEVLRFCGRTYSATLIAVLSPPWPDEEILQIMRSLRKTPSP